MSLFTLGEGMECALKIASRSEDPSVQNGAAIFSRRGNYLGGGANNPLVDMTPERWERPAKYFFVEHAERSAVINAMMYSPSGLTGATMYCPWASCADCARSIVMSGISCLVRFPMNSADGWDESITAGDEILRENKVEILEIPVDSVSIPPGLRLGQWRNQATEVPA